MKAQISGTSGVKFNLKFLLEIILIIVVGAVIFLLIVIFGAPNILGSKIANFSEDLYTLVRGPPG